MLITRYLFMILITSRPFIHASWPGSLPAELFLVQPFSGGCFFCQGKALQKQSPLCPALPNHPKPGQGHGQDQLLAIPGELSPQGSWGSAWYKL